MPSHATQTNQRLAVFTRNHSEFLDRAVLKFADYPPHCLFRSNVRWVAAKDALKDQCCVDVYIAPTAGKNEDGKNEVQYVAKLFDVILDPSESTILELQSAYPKLFPEAPWTGPAAQTLYLLSNCRKLPYGIPITDLVKSDGTKISPEYKYSYSLVKELSDHPEGGSGK